MMKEKIEKLIASAKEINIPMIKCGVYFLHKGSDIVYVGKSKNVIARVLAHEPDKDFDCVSVIPCSETEMDLIERILIDYLLPVYNLDNTTKKLKRILQERENRINSLLDKLK